MPFMKILSGFNLIDNLWGGFYKGRTYLISGPRRSGKTTLCLQIARKGLLQKEKVLYFTDMPASDLLLIGESLGFDLAIPFELSDFLIYKYSQELETAASDEILEKGIRDIIELISKENPSRVIFDQITQLLRFNSLDQLKSSFTEIIKSGDINKNVICLSVGKPASQKALEVYNILQNLTTATIKLESDMVFLKARIGYYPLSHYTQFEIKPRIGIVALERKLEEKLEEAVVPPIEEELEIPVPSQAETVPEEVKEGATFAAIEKKEEVILPSAPILPTIDSDKDDFTGFFNYEGLEKLFKKSLEANSSFSILIVEITGGVDSKAKRLLLMKRLAQSIQESLLEPTPIGRYSDKILVFLRNQRKDESQEFVNRLTPKVLANFTSGDATLKNVTIGTRLFSYPQEIKNLEEIRKVITEWIE